MRRIVLAVAVTAALALPPAASAGERPTSIPAETRGSTLTMPEARAEAVTYAEDLPFYASVKVGSCTRRRRDIVECGIAVRSLPPYSWSCRIRVRIRKVPPDFVYFTTPKVHCS